MSEPLYNNTGQNAQDQDQLLSELLQKFTQNNTNPSNISAPDTQSPRSQSPQLGSDMLSSLLSNPELISKLPQMMSAIKPMLELLGRSGSQPSSPPSSPPDGATTPSSALPAYPAASAKAKSDSDRAALLCAMKPYLSKDRQNAIDYIIKLSRLGDILKTL